MPCYLIDIDLTILDKGGTPFPGAVEYVNSLSDQGHQVWLFSCWPATNESMERLRAMGLRFHGMLPKPFDEEGYYWVDDKALGHRTSLDLPPQPTPLEPSEPPPPPPARVLEVPGDASWT